MKVSPPKMLDSLLPFPNRATTKQGMWVLERALETPSEDPGGVQVIKAVQDAFEDRFPPGKTRHFGPAAYAVWLTGIKIHQAGEAERFEFGTVAASTWNALALAPSSVRSLSGGSHLGPWFTSNWVPYLLKCGLTAAHLRQAKPDIYSDESMASDIMREIESAAAAVPDFVFGDNERGPGASGQAAESATTDPSPRTAPEHSKGPSRRHPTKTSRGFEGHEADLGRTRRQA